MPHATLTLFEHQSKPHAWTPRELRLLEAINRKAGAELLLERHGRIQATQYAGVVRLGETVIQILPKIHRVGADEGVNEREATANLLHLLAYAVDTPISEQGVAPLLAQHSDWFEVLIHLFASHLAALWQRGALHNYRAVDQELPLLKGKWRIADQLRQPASLHRFAVTSDEFTPDTEINRALRFVAERLWRLARDSSNRRQLDLLRQWMEDVTLPKTVDSAALGGAHITRLHRAYAPVINLARLFLENGALQLAAGATQTYSFVFDMNLLFESFVYRFLQRHRAQILPAEARAWQLAAQAQGHVCYLAHHEGRGRSFLLRPDIVAAAGRGEYPLLIDTKYKRLDERTAHAGVSPGDFYQMHAYASSYRSRRVILLYPQTAAHPAPLHHVFRLLPLQELRAVVEVHTIDLRRDLGSRAGRDGLIAELHGILKETTNPDDN